jgi:hypothetical protein
MRVHVRMHDGVSSNAARMCDCTRVCARMHDGVCSNAARVLLECSEGVDSNAREYVFDARSVGSSARMCGLKMDKAQGWALECTRCRLECSNVWAQNG